MKNVNIEHRHQVVADNNNKVYFAIKMRYSDKLRNSGYQMNTVEINDSSITGMRGIWISLDQTNYDVNITISNTA